MAVRKVTKTAPAPKSVTMPVPAADPELSEGAKRMLKQVQAMQVTTAQEYEAAAGVLINLTDRRKTVADKKAEMWDPLAKLTKAVQTLFNPPLKVLDQAIDIAKGKMSTYAVEQDNIRREKQRIADQEAEEARRKLLAKADKAEDAGMHDRALVIGARARSVQAETVDLDIPKVAGVQLRERWLFEIIDEADVPAEYRSVDEAKIRAAVNLYHDKLEIRGVRIWSTLKPQG